MTRRDSAEIDVNLKIGYNVKEAVMVMGRSA